MDRGIATLLYLLMLFALFLPIASIWNRWIDKKLKESGRM